MIISYSFSAVAGRMTVGYICRSHSVGRTIPLFCSLLVDKTAELFAQSRNSLTNISYSHAPCNSRNRNDIFIV